MRGHVDFACCRNPHVQIRLHAQAIRTAPTEAGKMGKTATAAPHTVGVNFSTVARVVKELRQGTRENSPQMMSAFVFPGRRAGAVRKDQPIHLSSLKISCLWSQMNRRDI